MSDSARLRVVTYNVHKCRGLDRRVRPERITEVLQEIDADIIALQEVLSIEGSSQEAHQASFIANQLGYDYRIGETRILRGGSYGNVILSRLPISSVLNFDISFRRREERGCLRADIALGQGQIIHVYNAHFGTAFFERRHQVRRLLDADMLRREHLKGPRLLLGDFNDWTRGLTSKLLSAHFDSPHKGAHLRRRRSYPGIIPLLHLDHIYFDDELVLEHAAHLRSPKALVASDHLPLIGDFRLPSQSSTHPSPGLHKAI